MTAGEPDDGASDALAVAIEEVLETEELDAPVTLGVLRTVLTRATDSRAAALRRLGPKQRDALIGELDELIHAHGRGAAADRFTPVCPCAGVDSLFEHAVAARAEATLEDVRSMIEQGLLAALIGAGEVAEDDEQPIRDRLETLIQRYGQRALAEDLIGRT